MSYLLTFNQGILKNGERKDIIAKSDIMGLLRRIIPNDNKMFELAVISLTSINNVIVQHQNEPIPLRLFYRPNALKVRVSPAYRIVLTVKNDTGKDVELVGAFSIEEIKQVPVAFMRRTLRTARKRNCGCQCYCQNSVDFGDLP